MSTTSYSENYDNAMVSQLNLIDTGHEDMIHDAEMDYLGLYLATCSSDHSVKVFNLDRNVKSKDDDLSQKKTLIAELKGHTGPVWQVAWAHPQFGTLLASCSYDRKVIIWRGDNGNWFKYYEYNNHDSSVNSISWAPKEFGLMLACGSSDGTISFLTYMSDTNSWETRKINAHTIGCNAVSWGPGIGSLSELDFKGSKLGSVGKRLVSGGCDNLIKIWKQEGDKWVEETKLENHSDWVRDVAWAPSWGLSKCMIASCSQDRKVIIWTSDDYITWTPFIMNIFDDVVWNVSWSLTGDILTVSCGDNSVSLWKENTDGVWQCITEMGKTSEQYT
uniref:Protein SEC13 homolog n=1 Tax=Cacopsylla melanoneura TaxID=428564 RepID=A0A8D8TJ96_9HEMI